MINKYRNIIYKEYNVLEEFETDVAYFLKLKKEESLSIIKIFKEKYEHLFSSNKFSLIKGINSNFLLKIKDVIETDDLSYIELEFFESLTLKERLLSKPKITKRKFFNILENIAIVIDLLHENNISHLDIDERNFLVDKDFNIKLHDFDFAEIIIDDNLKKIDIHSYVTLVYRILFLQSYWHSISDLKLKYNSKYVDYSSCIVFFNSLDLR